MSRSTPIDYTAARERLRHLTDPEVRFELGEDARNAELAALAAAHLSDLIEEVIRLRRILYPTVAKGPT